MLCVVVCVVVCLLGDVCGYVVCRRMIESKNFAFLYGKIIISDDVKDFVKYQ